MAHFAQVDVNNIVFNVIVVNNEVLENKEFPESESIGVEFCKFLFGSDTTWKQTSYNSNFRGRFAGIGMTYDPVKDEFVVPSAE
jgi:hypothetical protein